MQRLQKKLDESIQVRDELDKQLRELTLRYDDMVQVDEKAMSQISAKQAEY